jgi:hypothetical protein
VLGGGEGTTHHKACILWTYIHTLNGIRTHVIGVVRGSRLHRSATAIGYLKTFVVYACRFQKFLDINQ